MTERTDGGPTFPHNPDRDTSHGMSLRDWFAGQALAGLIANPGGPFQASELSGWTLVNCDQNHVAAECYRLSDSMLAERAK